MDQWPVGRSTCTTGPGEIRIGVGSGRAAPGIPAGWYPREAATLGQVPDQQSAQLMIRFFDSLAAN
jgi:hypothetical protein